MKKKIIACCASIGAGVAMLVNIGVGRGIGIATASAMIGVANNTTLAGDIEVLLRLGIRTMFIPLIIAFIAAIVLLIISKVCCGGCDPCHHDKCKKSALTCILSSIGAAVALLSGLGTAGGISIITAGTLEALAINPGAETLILEFAEIGSRSIYFAFAMSVAIAVLIVFCLLCSCMKRHHRHY